MKNVAHKIRQRIARPLLEAREAEHSKETETIMRTLLMIRKERDYRELLLCLVLDEGLIPKGPLRRRIGCAVALESESDIDRRDDALAKLKENL